MNARELAGAYDRVLKAKADGRIPAEQRRATPASSHAGRVVAERAPERSWASSVGVRRSMLANRSTNTKPEVALRRALHARGLRFRKDLRLDLPDCRVRPDIVFTRIKLAVFVDGCFWHRCPQHGTYPKANSDYWRPKLDRNAARDRLVDQALQRAGWSVLRVWEHEPIDAAADKVLAAFLRAPAKPNSSARRMAVRGGRAATSDPPESAAGVLGHTQGPKA